MKYQYIPKTGTGILNWDVHKIIIIIQHHISIMKRNKLKLYSDVLVV